MMQFIVNNITDECLSFVICREHCRLIDVLHFFQPGCMYRVRVKTGDSNPHIERASPSFIDIQVKNC